MKRRTLLSAPAVAYAQYEESKGDVPWVPTPDEVIDLIMRVARATPRDTVLDLGSGDGRVLIYSALKFGTRGIGIEIEGHRVAEARAEAEKAGVSQKVRFVEQDFFKADVSKATIVFMYLFTAVMGKLKPKLLSELMPGTRVVAYQFNGMGDWMPSKVLRDFQHPIYYWEVPRLRPAKPRAAK